MPLLPLSLDGQRLQPRRAIARIGEHTRQVMRELGYSDAHIAQLCAAGVLKTDDAA
jgi:crotonobetainyl-CoA:carnitine CoA-transferase CaiB-like acyl-CoA transferase